MLEVKDLTTYYKTRQGPNQALEELSFKLEHGEMLGLIGESGCGKSTAAVTIMRLLFGSGEHIKGQVMLDGLDIMNVSQKDFEKITWKDIALIPQSAMNALNPVYNVGKQINEAIMLHYPGMSKANATEKTKKLLKQVGLDERWFNAYPHKLSGGMKQRAIIAMAFSCDPKVLISDESTTGLDVIIEAQILALLKNLQKARNLSIIIISHDLRMVTSICDRIAIMYAGVLVEIGKVEDVARNGRHPYTRALFNSQVNLDSLDIAVESIEGVVPKLINPPAYCRFYGRCKSRTDFCRENSPPALKEISSDHQCACYNLLEEMAV